MALTDAFTDTNGTLLESHVSPGGQTYTLKNTGTGNGSLSITGNQIAANSVAGGNPIYEWVVGALSSNITFSIDYLMPLASPATFYFSLTVRGSDNGVSYFGYVGLVDRVGGVLTFHINRDGAGLASIGIPALDDAAAHTLRLDCQGALLTLYVDGVKRLQATDVTYTTQGQSRINVHAPTAASLPAGFYLDNASIAAAAAQTLSLAPLVPVPVVTGNRLYLPIRAAVFYLLTGGRRNVLTTNTQGGSGGGTQPPVTGQLWPRGQKTG